MFNLIGSYGHEGPLKVQMTCVDTNNSKPTALSIFVNQSALLVGIFVKEKINALCTMRSMTASMINKSHYQSAAVCAFPLLFI